MRDHTTSPRRRYELRRKTLDSAITVVHSPEGECPMRCNAWHGISYTAKLIGVSRRTVHRLIKRGRFLSHKTSFGPVVNHRQALTYEKPLACVGSIYDYGYSCYLFKMQEFYKIGQARDVGLRLAGFQGLPFKVSLVHSIRTRRPKEAEAFLHAKFDAKRVRPKIEWFNLAPDDVAWLQALIDYEVDGWLGPVPAEEQE